MLAAARRIVLLFGIAIAVTAGMSWAIGVALGAPAARSAAIGLYLAGCFLAVLGVFAGVRGPLRPSGKEGEEGDAMSLLGVGIFSKGVRQATGDERADAQATAWMFLLLGIAMILTGIGIDPRTSVF